MMDLGAIHRADVRKRQGGGVGAGLLGIVVTGGVAAFAISAADGDAGINGVYGAALVGVVVGFPAGYVLGRKIHPPRESWINIWAR